MQRSVALALGRAACLSARRAGSAARVGRPSSLASQPPVPTAVVGLRQLHYTMPAAAGGKEDTFLDREPSTARVMAVVKNFEKVDDSKVTDKASFKDDLALDSLDAVEVVMAIEDEFSIEIPDSEADKILTIADAVNFVITHPAAK